jgi:Mn2+/Fe2+ NRAMP family transporter
MRPPGKLSSVVLYSVISAAFIGPGTITTAITAGATHQLQLLWAVSLGTLGCLVLQEVSARIVIGSGLTLRQAAQQAFGIRFGKILMFVVGVSVFAGCLAYEAGNILGAVSGLNLLAGADTRWLTFGVAAAAFVVLWTNKRQVISWIMTFLVAMMGLAFFVLAFRQSFSFAEVVARSTVPGFPPGSSLLILGLVGTTIVPYNIFLGSGISKGKTIPLMRFGLAISVLVGGMITAAILIAGTAVGTFTSFAELAQGLEHKLGVVGSLALAVGLFAAGFSSAITAPYASSIIASTVFGWTDQKRLRLVWGAVLLTGFFFGISGIKPIPVILTVQALNGLILPLLVVLLIGVVNHRAVIPVQHLPGLLYNLLLLLMLGSVVLIGLNQVEKVLISLNILTQHYFTVLATCSGVLVVAMGVWVVSVRKIADGIF